MKSIKYSKFNPEDLGIDLEDLLGALSELFLRSGFDNPYMQFSELNRRTLDDLKKAIEEALERGDLFSSEQMEQMQERLQQMTAQQREQLIDRLVEKLQEGGYLSFEGDEQKQAETPGSAQGRNGPQVHFEVTDKALDFLGYKTLKDLLGSLGKSS